MKSPRRSGRPVQPTAQFRIIADLLRKRIATKEWAPGSAIPSLRSLAKEYEVPLDVMRAAVNVMRKEERLGVTANRRLTVVPGMSQIPAMSLERLVLLVYTAALDHMLSNPEIKAIHDGIQMELGRLCIPFLTAHCHTLRTATIDGFFQLPFQGMISIGTHEASVLAAYERLPFPVVIADQPIRKHKLHSVCVDNVAGSKDAVERLVALGHRRIAFVRLLWTSTSSVDPDSQERELGFQNAVRAMKLKGCEVFSVIQEDRPEGAAYQAIASKNRGFTAALCADVFIATHLRNALALKNRNVPADFSVIAFHGSTQPLRFSGPCTDFYTMGKQAVETMQKPRRPALCERILPSWRDHGTQGRCTV